MKISALHGKAHNLLLMEKQTLIFLPEMFPGSQVVARGGCSFTQKVLTAQSAGAIGCLVVNNEPKTSAMQV